VSHVLALCQLQASEFMLAGNWSPYSINVFFVATNPQVLHLHVKYFKNVTVLID